MAEIMTLQVLQPFYNELLTVYQAKLPLSRTKVHSVTKTALKAMRYYKHVVKNIEKFIHKCRPEYKLAALYIMDSIIRQSRHQYGGEKDVFGPRFSLNINETFESLYQCRQDDRPKITRVLKLWMDNGIYSDEIIQPLLDMGLSEENSIRSAASNVRSTSVDATPTDGGPGKSQSIDSQQNVFKDFQSLDNSVLKDMLKRVGAAPSSSKPGTSFTREALFDDFDYGDDEDDAARIAEQRKRLAEEANRRKSEEADNASKKIDIINPAEILNQYQQFLANTAGTVDVKKEESLRHYDEEMPLNRSRTTTTAAGDEDFGEGIPQPQAEKVTVCSTTIFVGRLPRSVNQDRLTETFERYGPVKSVDLIPPRGCAFICMQSRQDTVLAVQNLQNLRIQNNNCKVAFAPGKGIKSRFKDYWNVDLGVSYIPWDALKESSISVEILEEGGYVDIRTLPPGTAVPEKAADTKVIKATSLTTNETNGNRSVNERNIENDAEIITASKIPVLQRSNDNSESNSNDNNDASGVTNTMPLQLDQGGIPMGFNIPPPLLPYRGVPPMRAPMGSAPIMYPVSGHPMNVNFPPFPPRVGGNLPVQMSMNHSQQLMPSRMRGDFGPPPPPLHQFRPSVANDNIRANRNNNSVVQLLPESSDNKTESNDRRSDRHSDNRKRYRDDRNEERLHDRDDDRNDDRSFGGRSKRDRRYNDNFRSNKRDRRSRPSRWDDRNDR